MKQCQECRFEYFAKSWQPFQGFSINYTNRKKTTTYPTEERSYTRKHTADQRRIMNANRLPQQHSKLVFILWLKMHHFVLNGPKLKSALCKDFSKQPWSKWGKNGLFGQIQRWKHYNLAPTRWVLLRTSETRVYCYFLVLLK